MVDPKESALSKALARAGGASTDKGGLGGALARRTGAPATVEGPKTADLSKVEAAVHNSADTSHAVLEDEKRDREKRNGICFVVDATGSREASWRQAQVTQGEMFDSLKEFPNIEVGVICHRGDKVEKLGWFKDSQTAKSKMSSVSCVGGHTCIVQSLTDALAGHDGKPPSSIIMIGDCFEERMSSLESVLKELSKARVKVYAFLEGSDYDGTQAYRMAAEMTGGVFKQFGQGLGLTMSDLCTAAAVHDQGGLSALEKMLKEGHKGAAALLTDLKKRQLGAGNNMKSLGM